MIAQVLAFVRGEQVRETREPLDLHELAAACVIEAAELGWPVTLERGGEQLPIMGERIHLHRALSNLIENAVTYGGGAHVRTVGVGKLALAEVEDKGPGLAETDLERVFEPFVRLEPSRSRTTGGTGLGLASARVVVRAHGGDVVLVNRTGGGLTARVTLEQAAKT